MSSFFSFFDLTYLFVRINTAFPFTVDLIPEILWIIKYTKTGYP